jgi:hypothetical protein
VEINLLYLPLTWTAPVTERNCAVTSEQLVSPGKNKKVRTVKDIPTTQALLNYLADSLDFQKNADF